MQISFETLFYRKEGVIYEYYENNILNKLRIISEKKDDYYYLNVLYYYLDISILHY